MVRNYLRATGCVEYGHRHLASSITAPARMPNSAGGVVTEERIFGVLLFGCFWPPIFVAVGATCCVFCILQPGQGAALSTADARVSSSSQ